MQRLDTHNRYSEDTKEFGTQLLQTSPKHGLSEKEATKRLNVYGKNILAQRSRYTFLLQFLSTFFSPLILLLLGASVISAIAGESKDFFIILSIVIVSGSVTFYQHFKAEYEAEKLKQKVLLNATVLRDGVKKEIQFSHICIGDIILLTVGDIIPADAKILQGKDVSVDESTLTGEAFPAEKEQCDNEKTPCTEKQHHLLMGTHIITGEATALVTAIGRNCEFGKLSKEILVTKPVTSFDKDINEFVLLTIRFVLLLTVSVFIINAVIHHEFLQSFLFALALAVGLAPELMPVILTINLSQGAIRMEKKEVIVKYLPSIQNLGSMNILCTDKTGTLTENKITLQDYIDATGKQNKEVLFFGVMTSFFQSGFRNPLDESLLKHSQGIDFTKYKKIDELPFDFNRKSLSVVVEENETKKRFLITKGAPHDLFPLLTKEKKETHSVSLREELKKSLVKQYETLSLNGLRVITVAIREISSKQTYTLTDEVDLEFVGFITFLDPIKKTVIETIKNLSAEGITIKILTGDNELVTKRICTDAGLPITQILTGDKIDMVTDHELSELVQTTHAFARLTPDQKAKIINMLKINGNVVGYLGDGINDAPPLKMADVGISVNNGSDIAKDVADIVLMKKSLAVLQEGVILGRKTHVNILKYILMEISSNFGNMLTVAGASFFLPFLPMLPVQILLNNFLYDISQISICVDNVDNEQITQPGKWNKDFIKKFTLVFGPISSLFDFLTFFILLNILHSSPGIFQTGWFLESLVTQTIVIFAIRTKKIPFFRSKPSFYLLLSSFLVIVAGFLIIHTSVSTYFSFVRLPVIFYPLLGLIIFLYFSLVETTKIYFYRTQPVH